MATGSSAGLYPAVTPPPSLQLHETHRSPSASAIASVYTRSLDVTITYTMAAVYLLVSRYIVSFLGRSWSLTYHLQPDIFHPSTKANHRSGENSLCPPSSTTAARGSWTSAFESAIVHRRHDSFQVRKKIAKERLLTNETTPLQTSSSGIHSSHGSQTHHLPRLWTLPVQSWPSL